MVRSRLGIPSFNTIAASQSRASFSRILLRSNCRLAANVCFWIPPTSKATASRKSVGLPGCAVHVM